MQDILIIGGGTAGLTAAIYARRAGLSCTVFEGGTPGGKIVASPEVANYPAMPKVSGFDYAMALLKQVQELGAEIVYESVTGADICGKIKRLHTANGEYEGKTVIIANGASRKKLGCKGEAEFEGRGVSYCATCDGAFFRGKAVAVVGGGDTAFEDAAYLAGICSKVYLIHRGDSFTASDVLQKPVLENKNITVLTNSEVSEVSGESSVNTVTVRSRANGSEAKISAASQPKATVAKPSRIPAFPLSAWRFRVAKIPVRPMTTAVTAQTANSATSGTGSCIRHPTGMQTSIAEPMKVVRMEIR